MPWQPGVDGTLPRMPDGNIQPGGDNALPPQMPDDHQNAPDDGNMPGWQGGTNPEMPDGANQGELQRPDRNITAPTDESMTSPPSDMPEQRETVEGDPNVNMSFDPRGDQTPDELTGVSDKAQWGLIGVSAFVLAVGLLIAAKKKY